MHKHTHAHAGFGGFGYRLGERENPIVLVGVRCVLPAGSEVSQSGNGGSQVASGFKSTFKFPSTFVVVALKFWVWAGCGDKGTVSIVWLCLFFIYGV